MKLVRDCIGDISWPDEHSKSLLSWVAPDSPEYRELLRLKLFEEAGELADADRRGDPHAVLEEAADVFEVLRALLFANGCAAVPGIARQVLANAVDRKFAERGGFFQGRTWSGSERVGHPAKAPVNDLWHALNRFCLVGDEDTGVGLNCDECWRGGAPIAYYDGGGFNPYRGVPDVVTVLTISDLLAAASAHLAEAHPASTPANSCCDDSGFADYAAVPCPNPTCTAPPMGGKVERIVEDVATATERGAVPFVHMIEDPDDERQARSVYGLGVPEGGFRRAREAAERLPTVGQWPAPAEIPSVPQFEWEARAGRNLSGNMITFAWMPARDEAEARRGAGWTGAYRCRVVGPWREVDTSEMPAPCLGFREGGEERRGLFDLETRTWGVVRLCADCGWPEVRHAETAPRTPPVATEAGEGASTVGEDAPNAPEGVQAAEEYTGRCPKCSSRSWVSASLNGGYTRVPQCVPCGAIHHHVLGPGWRG